jgi:hypothetical protein
MELSGRQRAAAFAAIVAALAVLSWYLFRSPAAGAGTSAPPRSGSGAHQAGRAVRPGATAPAAGQPSGTGPSGPEATPSGPAAAGQGGRGPDIYQWLPFTRSDLAAAANDAIRFGTAYGSYSYTKDTRAYLAQLRGLVTPALTDLLGRAYSAPGVASQRERHKQVSTAHAVISSLRGFGPSSLIFVLAITARITEDSGRSQVTTDYAVTLTGSGTSWRVSDIELASAGNS